MRTARAVRNFNFGQLLHISADKYDAGYRLRRFLPRRQARFEGPVVLLPVAHVNATRTALAYAATVPQKNFLLVATRESGWSSAHSGNIVAARLSSYAREKFSASEYKRLLSRWEENEVAFCCNKEISVLTGLDSYSGVPKALADGLAIRDAWIRVFEKEQINAVFCTDDTNPYTNMPLLLAKQRGLPTIACHHGALDGNYLVKRSHAELVLAKNQMEADYLVNMCGVPKDKIEVGSPAQIPPTARNRSTTKDSIVVFSEPYELDGGRCLEFYRELLPPLADLARRMNRDLVIKLHPMESARERRSLANACLSALQRQNMRIVEGPLSEDLLARVFFAVTLQSTAALDCTIRGIPVFLSEWLNFSPYGYVEQFIRSGAGYPLRSPSEIASIPALLDNFSPAHASGLLNVISAARLAQLLDPKLQMSAAG